MKNSLKLTAVALALSLAACSNDSSDEEKTQEESTAPAATEAPSEANTPAAPASNPNLTYLEENKGKDGVHVTESGLQYRVIEEGNGETPSAEDFVEVHYAGRLIDGSEFDSSYKRGTPAIFPAGRLIKGWTEALTMMPVGSKWELVIPAEIGYGERGAGDVIPPGATLVFDVELISISTEEAAMEARKKMMEAAMAERKALAEKQKVEQVAFLETNGKKDGITTTESGLQYRVIEAGSGQSPHATSQVTVHYAGTLIDGSEFDSSYKRGQPISFGLDQVIKGWTEGVQLMKEGGKYEFFIPYDLGYGENGTPRIPPYATLIFTVELISVDS